MPATGIPALERLVARLFIRRFVRNNPVEHAPILLRDQQRTLAAMIDRAGPDAERRVQIKRLRGLEQSSTNYSLAMVARHLAMINRDLATTLSHLKAGRPCPIVVSTANYKPPPDTRAPAAMRELTDANDALARELADPGAIRASRVTHVHPWFGPLSCEVWACFGPFHQALHLRQADAIVAGF
ncbi:MAG TPA: hypothetical protein VD997_10660 [Phycisphaerales bacterium]|nr:hypothetical protein [Phycisphaerales bacterium]